MTNIIEIDKPNLCFVGDIHGAFKSLQSLLKHTGFKDTAFIICGDIGFGFNKPQYYTDIFNKLTKGVSKVNCEFLFVRGNHDSKSYFDKRKINRKCFKTIPDYSVIKTPTHDILCIGGGISIDRNYRKNLFESNVYDTSLYRSCSLEEAEKITPQLYWPDESCYYDEKALNELKLNGINIDIVCTHTCPSFAKPIGKSNITYWLEQDDKLEEDIDKERKVMDDIYNKLKNDGHEMKYWIYGHYHYHNMEIINDTKFIMLDMYRNGFYDICDIPIEE